MPHAGRLLPSSADIWLPGDLEYNISQMWTWAADEQKKLGHNPAYKWAEFRFDSKHLAFVEGLVPLSEPMIRPVSLDLETYRGSSPQQVREGVSLAQLAGLDAFVLLALNPQVVPKMGTDIPHMWVPAFRANWPGGRDWQYVPLLYWYFVYGRRLDASISSAGHAYPHCTVVVRRGVS